MFDPERSDLYASVILDHNERPRHFYAMDDATHAAEGVNPVCGDRFRIFLEIDGELIKRASFLGRGCALSKASASMMVSTVSGQRINEAIGLRDVLHESLTSNSVDSESIGEMEALLGVRDHPSRVRCVMLAWDAMVTATE